MDIAISKIGPTHSVQFVVLSTQQLLLALHSVVVAAIQSNAMQELNDTHFKQLCLAKHCRCIMQ